MEKKTDIELQPKQFEAYKTLQRSESGSAVYTFYGGAKGGGKSYLVRANEFSRRMEYPGTTGTIIRKNYPELLSNHIRKFFIEYPETRAWYRASEKTIYYPNGSLTEFNYLQYTNDVYHFQGIEFDDITLDEATQHEEEVFKILKTSLRSDPAVIARNPKFKSKFLLTGNPGGIGHGWVKRLFVDRKFDPNETPAQYTFIPALIYDNPIFIKANPEYLKNLQDLPDDLRRAYLDGDWDVFIGQFFQDFRRDVHGVEPFAIDANWGKLFAVDWGYSPHPCHVGWYATDYDGTIYKYREAEFLETSPADVGERIRELSAGDKGLRFGVGDTQMWEVNPFRKTGGDEFYSDKSIALQINAELGKSNLLMLKANKARVTGWANLRSLLKWDGKIGDNGKRKIFRPPKYFIFNTCKATLAAYPAQIHSKLNPEDMLKQDGDDACDTDRYAIMYIRAGAREKEQPRTLHEKIMIEARRGRSEPGEFSL